MSTINQVKVRATVEIFSGDSDSAIITVETPYILSFSVNKSRGQVSTASISLKIVNTSVTFTSGNNLSITAGTSEEVRKIYTGKIDNISIRPCFDDPLYVLVDIQSSDVLSRLNGKKYTRRCLASLSSFVVIKGVTRPGLRSGKFKYDGSSVQFDTVSDRLSTSSNLVRAPNAVGGVEKAPNDDNVDTANVTFEVTNVND